MTVLFNRASQKFKRRSLRKNMPPAERLLWRRIRNYQLKGYKFRRQYSIAQFIIDFYCPRAKLAVEIDGESHQGLSAEKYDECRQKQIESLGIKVLRFTNWDIYENLEGALDTILMHLI